MLKNCLFALFLIIVFSGTSYGQTQDLVLKVKTNGAKLTEGEKTNSKSLKTLNKGDLLTFLEVINPSGSTTIRFKVEFEGITGFISSYFVEENHLLENEIARVKELDKLRKEEELRKYDSLNKVKEKERQEYRDSWEEREKEQIRKNDSIADVMLKNAKTQGRIDFQNRLQSRREKYHKKYGKEVGERIANEKIWIGMTEEMLIDSWGNPDDINTTVTRYSNRKQYVYGLGQYVYVVNGKVDAWQN
ncbi:hypothetical protein FHS59_004058 [Algoriphagus iocasae]|uniref:SH3b domain-containing protein n=1 Tax=Algoriphagus iocasae TaxID=1836499 RepID=A0A841N161_9BACT|nr:hypothetical protein [Algoriphagus iocasae]MBB6328415.1 hypothetical protein [Algoriphagus iocasae]